MTDTEAQPVLSHSSSTDSVSSMNNSNPPRCCHVCKEEVDVLQEARSHCVDCNMYLCARDAKIHIKQQPTHHVIDLIGASTSSLSGSGIGHQLLDQLTPRSGGTSAPGTATTSTQSLGGPAPLCLIHHIPINTYCGSCKKLVCSACAVESHREGHTDVNMISKIEPEERANLDNLMKNLRESMRQWESSHETHDDELAKESSLIDDEKNRLKEEVKSICDTLRQNIQERQDQLNSDIDEVTKVQTLYVQKIIELKKSSVDYMSEFDRLHEMSGYEMMDRKLTRLPQTLQAFEDLKNEFKYLTLKEVHDVQLQNTENILKYIQREIKQLGEIIKTPPKQKSDVPASSTTATVGGATSSSDNSSSAAENGKAQDIHRFKPFSMDFTYVATIGKSGNDGSGNDQFKGPWDVKISQNCSVIVVSDSRNNRIQFFDLNTREYKGTLKTPKNPRSICVEAGSDGNDSLIFSCDNHAVYKYSLNKVLASDKCDPIWISGTPKKKGSDTSLFSEPTGIALCKSKKINSLFPEALNENTILVCDSDNNRIKVLRASDAKVLKTFGAKKDDKGVQLNQPESIIVTSDDQIIITEYGSHRVQCVVRKGDELSSLKIIGRDGQSNLEFSAPRGVVADETSRTLIVCDSGNNRIQVFNHINDEFKRNFGTEGKDNQQFNRPVGCCFNEATGELLIADHNNHRIQIFK